jgi:hypothetical protein
MGKGTRRVEANAGGENTGHRETKSHHLASNPQENRGGTKGEMGQLPGSAEESGLE